MRLAAWVLWLSFVIGSTTAHEPQSTRPYVQFSLKLIGLCDWWITWGRANLEEPEAMTAWQWDHTCRGYHTADI